MSKSATLLLGLVGFMLILGLAVYNGTEKIEDDLSTRGRSLFDEQGLTWVTMDIDGRHLHLSGKAPSEKAATKALELAENLYGVDRVDDEFSFAANPVKTEKPTSGAEWSSSIKAQ